MDTLGFGHLVLASSISVAQAAQRYGRSKRTIRSWCERSPIGVRIAGGGYCVSLPLADLYALGNRYELKQFLDGKRLAPEVVQAFDDHGARSALVAFLRREIKPVAPELVEAFKTFGGLQAKAGTKQQTRQKRQAAAIAT